MSCREDITVGDHFRHRVEPALWFTVRKKRRRTVLGDMGIVGVGELMAEAALSYSVIAAKWTRAESPAPITPDPGMRQR